MDYPIGLELIYLVASITYIVGLKLLGHPETARRGNLIAAGGMTLAILGTLFFYPNTLQHDGETAFNQGVNGRSPWFNCSCCPSNLSRFIPSVAGYAYARHKEQIYVNLYMNSQVGIETPEGRLELVQATSYPWEGHIQLDIMNEEPVREDLLLRIPGWALNKAVPSDLFLFASQQGSQAAVKVNGVRQELEIQKGYAVLRGHWKKGDRIILELPMEDRLVVAHEQVEAKKGRVAVQYGPLVYCAEQVDNDVDVLEVGITAEARFVARFEPGLLGGVNMLQGEELRLVPYYAWANRDIGKMNVWFHEKN
mgnify:CR=1 FL=1